MLSVLGAGSYYAETILSNALLAEVGNRSLIEKLGQEFENVSRRSSLPESYIRETGNLDPREAKKAALFSPTELAARASRLAAERAGISVEQISAVIGDCCTPYQVTPAEGQRVAESLDLKVPAYDVTSSTGPIPAHLDAILNWRDERVPEYTLLVAATTATHRINFRRGHEPFFFGDAAGALLVSARHEGKLKVVDAKLSHRTDESGTISFDKFGHAIYPRSSEALLIELAQEAAAKAIAASGVPASEVKFIGPEVSASSAKYLARSMGITPQNHWSLVHEIGNTLGAAPILVLTHYWDQIAKGDRIVCVQVGVGLSYGYAVFEAIR